MGLLDFLDGALNKLNEHAPEIMEQMQKAQDRAQRNEARMQAQTDAYRARYSRMSNQELQDIADQGVTGAERAALASIAQERREEREKYKRTYSNMSSTDLRVQYNMVKSQKNQGRLDGPSADMRLSIISNILKSRGWHLNSDLEWYK